MACADAGGQARAKRDAATLLAASSRCPKAFQKDERGMVNAVAVPVSMLLAIWHSSLGGAEAARRVPTAAARVGRGRRDI